MRRNPQRGMTLVELLVAMAVTSILLLGLGNVLFDVSGRYQAWTQRLQAASTGTGLYASLQVDAHRYVACTQPVAFNLNTYQLDFCQAQDVASGVIQPLVRYRVSSSQPYIISREQPVGSSDAFMARSAMQTRPSFWVDCLSDGGTVSGHVHVYYLRLYDGLGGTNNPYNFSVYYVAPWRPGC